MENPKVSIFCLSYNQADFIIESLESIKSQTFQDFELLIIDDFSKDNSVQVIDVWINNNEQINVTFIKHTENKGICKSLNELLHFSKGKYIQMLALDDIILDWKLEKHVSILDKSHSNQVMVFSDAFLMDDQSNLFQNKFIALHKKYLSLSTSVFYDQLLEGNFIPAMSVLVKKESILEVNGWDENLAYEDYDMWLRLSKKEVEFIFNEEASCIYRLHKNNTHKKDEIMSSSIFDILCKHVDRPEVVIKIQNYLAQRYIIDGSNDQAKAFYKRHKSKKMSTLAIRFGLPIFFFRIFYKFNI